MSDKMKSSELRKLVRMFNKRNKITIPKGLKGQAEMIKFLEKHGEINHKSKSFNPYSTKIGETIRLSDYEKMFPPKTEAQKAEAKQKAQTRKESSEANMVKTLEGKGYKITKPKTAEKKPTPAPKKPVKKAPEPKKKANIPAIQKSLKELVYEGVDDLLKDDSVRVGGAVSALKKGYMKMIDSIVMETAEKKQLKEEWKQYDKYIRSEWKLYDKPAKKAPAPKKKTAPKKKEEKKIFPQMTFKEIVSYLRKKAKDKSTDEDGDRIYSDNTLKTLKEILDIYKTLPYSTHKDKELYDILDEITGYRGDEASKYDTFLNTMKSYAKDIKSKSKK